MLLTLTQKKWISAGVVIVAWGLLIWSVTQAIELDRYAFGVGTTCLVIYSCLSLFGSIYLGFLFCRVDFLDPVDNPIWHCIYSTLALLLIPASILNTILVAMLYIKSGDKLSNSAIVFCWIAAGLGLAYSLTMITYAFFKRITESIKKHREFLREKQYKQGLEVLNDQLGRGVYSKQTFTEVYKNRVDLQHNLESPELIYLKKYFLKSCFTTLTSGTFQGETGCSICQTEWDREGSIFVMPECRHSFDQDCIEKWLEQSIRCPICKGSVRKNLILALEKLEDSPEPSHIELRVPPPEDHAAIEVAEVGLQEA